MLNIINTEKFKYLKIPSILFASFIFSYMEMSDKPAPFAAAFMAGLSGLDCAYVFIGAVLSHVFKGNLAQAAPNLIVLIFIAIFRLLFAKNGTDNKLRSFTNIASTVVCAAAVLTANMLTLTRPGDVFSALIFSLCAAAAAYSFMNCYNLFGRGYYLSLLKPVSIACLSISSAVVIGALTSFNVSMFNLGMSCAVLVCLAVSQKYRYSGGAIAGTVAALGISIDNPSYMSAGLIIVIAALGCALFARLGKVTIAAGYLLICGICVMLFGSEQNIVVMSNAFLGSLLFVILPTSQILSRIKYSPVSKSDMEVTKIFAERLKMSAVALKEVKSALEKTAQILDRNNKKEVSWVYNSACGDVCKKCKHAMSCWGDRYNDTIKTFNSFMPKLRKGESVTPDDFEENLSHCEKKKTLCVELNARYKEYTSANAAGRKISEMRHVLTAQLSATEKMILDMAQEFTEYERFDRKRAVEIESILAACGAKKVRAAVYFSHGRALAEAFGKGVLDIPPEKLCDKISAALEIEFDLPELEYDGADFRLTMYERAVFSIEYGASQHNKSGERNCGDYYESFVDARGFAYIILSDGMGSGARARIDSSFASGMLVKLLRCNVNPVSAIEMINNSLLVKSSDESFATLDICRIDLYSGEVELYKAGGAPTYIRSDKKLIKASAKGMPVGIDSKVNFAVQRFNIEGNDIIIMTSDGAELNEKWLEYELKSVEKKSTDMGSIAKSIAAAAKYSTEKGKEDDISVIAVRVVDS